MSRTRAIRIFTRANLLSWSCAIISSKRDAAKLLRSSATSLVQKWHLEFRKFETTSRKSSSPLADVWNELVSCTGLCLTLQFRYPAAMRDATDRLEIDILDYYFTATSFISCCLPASGIEQNR